MKFRPLILLSLIATAIIIASCTEDKYVNWKQLNDTYLTNNLKNDSVKQTASGLQYKVIYPGWSYNKKVELSSQVSLDIQGKMIDGSTFQPRDTTNFYVPNLVKGMQEGLTMMHVGATYVFYIPGSLGYGDSGNGIAIPPHSTLIFYVTVRNAVN